MAGEKCVLSSSCCGCSLRSGSLAIGIISLIFGILYGIFGIYNGVKGHKEGWVTLVVNLITIAICIILIQGIRKERRGWVMTWVWTTGIIIAINIILIVIGIILTLNFIGGIIALICMGIAVYCVLVVRSYALSLGSVPSMA
ncbi:uncharacterized protein [Procambarus clarkii]|nr:uncharacterized protein LOC123755131 isoform X2 [Procambarus clarkii]